MRAFTVFFFIAELQAAWVAFDRLEPERRLLQGQTHAENEAWLPDNRRICGEQLGHQESLRRLSCHSTVHPVLPRASA
jgi:hypothetical protein